VILSTLILAFSISSSTPEIAVVNSIYDRISPVLTSWKIPHDILEARDLENPDVLKRYRSVFIPCGVDAPLDTSINLLSRGTHIQSVTLKKDYYEPRRDRIGKNLRDYIRSGGSVYVSGYAFKYLQEAMPVLHFFDRFPYMGMSERVEAELSGDMAVFCGRESANLFMSHSGWIAVKKIDGATILARASFNTPRGTKEGPLCAIIPGEGGEILWSSFHTNAMDDYRRFTLARIASSSFFHETLSWAESYGGSTVSTITDILLPGETVRAYRMNLPRGTSTVFLHSEKTPFQVDICDGSMALIMSRDLSELRQRFDIHLRKEGHIWIRLFPSGKKRNGFHSIIVSSNAWLIPYGKTIVIILGILSAIGLFQYARHLRGKRGYHGRIWRWIQKNDDQG